MKIVLITGAYGFLGRYTAALFNELGFRVIGIGHGHWGFENPKDFGIDQWIEADIDFYSLTKIKERIDCIVHCAGGSSVGYSVQYPMRDFHRTVTASINILEYIRLKQPQAKLIYPSSAAVYGVKDDRPIKEDASLKPFSPYGFHKKIVEELCVSYIMNFGLSVTIIRFFSVYGPGLKKQLLWDACKKFSQHGKEIVFFGTGAETRDWIHVKDAAKLIYHMFHSEVENVIVNGGCGEKKSIKQILNLLAGCLDVKANIVFNQQCKEGDPKHYWADITKAGQNGWKPQIDIDKGLRNYGSWFNEQKKS